MIKSTKAEELQAIYKLLVEAYNKAWASDDESVQSVAKSVNKAIGHVLDVGYHLNPLDRT